MELTDTMYLSKLMLFGPANRLKSAVKVVPHECTYLSSIHYINTGVFIDLTGSEVILGRGVELSDGVRIITHGHEFHDPGWKNLPDVVSEKPLAIMDFAFIGINAIILPGCKTIGKHAVVGAGSVVTRDVPDYEIWGGNPARKIGEVERD